MGSNHPEPLEASEVRLLHWVAQAVEAGEVSAKLLTDLQAACEAALGRRPVGKP